MTFAIDTLNLFGGIIELIALVICANFLGVLYKYQLNKIRIILCLILYIGITTLENFLTNVFVDLIGPFAVLVYYLRIVLVIAVLYRSINNKIIYLTAFLDLSISLVVTSSSCFLANLFEKDINIIIPFVKIFVQTALLIIFISISNKIDSQRSIIVFAMIPRHIYILQILAIICLSALSSLISFPTDNKTMKENALTVIVIMLAVIFICIVISLFLNVIAKQHFTAVSQMMEKQVELQISHYENLEKMDAEIRKFRHDYTNHLRSILSLIRMRECSQAEEYIEKLQKTEYKFHTPMFYTGNRLADAILSEKSATLNEDCRIEYSGIIPSSIENVDLCIILSNALDNAVEACRALQTQCVISIFAGKQQGYFVLSIKNPTVCSENFYEIPPTTKSDKTQHGMGLYNIESAVKKYDGQIKVQCENGVFELMITIKI